MIYSAFYSPGKHPPNAYVHHSFHFVFLEKINSI